MDIPKQVILQLQHLKTVSFGIALPVGSAHEPFAGISSILLNHIFRNSQKHDEDSLANYIDRYGFSNHSTVFRSSQQIGLKVPPRHLAKAIELLRELVFEPQFDEQILQQIISSKLGNYQQMQTDPESLLSNDIRWQAAFPDQPIAHSPIGNPDGYAKVTVESLESWWHEMLRQQPVFAAVGYGVTETELKNAGIDDFLDGFGSQSNDTILASPPTLPYHTMTRWEDDSLNTYFSLNYRLERPEVTYADAMLMRAILGGGESSRLFLEIREKRNLSYAPYITGIDFQSKQCNSIMMDVRPDRAEEALKVSLDQLQDILTKPIPDEEMQRALKLARRLTVFLSDSSSNYLNFILRQKVAGKPFDIMQIDADLKAAAANEWIENILKEWIPSNFSLAMTGASCELEQSFSTIMEEYQQ